MALYGYPFVIEDKQRVKPTDPRLTSQREITFLSVKVVYFHSKLQNTHSQQLRTHDNRHMEYDSSKYQIRFMFGVL